MQWAYCCEHCGAGWYVDGEAIHIIPAEIRERCSDCGNVGKHYGFVEKDGLDGYIFLDL